MALFGQDRPQIGGGFAALGQMLSGGGASSEQAYLDQLTQGYRAQGYKHDAAKAFEEAGMARNQRIAMEGIGKTLEALGQNPALGGMIQASSGGNAEQLIGALLGGQEFSARGAATQAALGGDLAGANAHLFGQASGPQALTKVAGGVAYNPFADSGQSLNVTPLGQSEIDYDRARIAKTYADAARGGAGGGAGKAPAGYRWSASGDRLEPIPGGPAEAALGGAGGMKLTEGQSKDVNYFTRGNAANARLSQSAANLTYSGGQQGARGIADSLIRSVPFVGDSGPANLMVSPQYQLAEQDGREFLAAILRKDTGAAITNQEMEIYGKMYLPQPGDPPQVLAQKAKSRETALKAMEAGLGSARAAVPVIDPTAPALGAAPAAGRVLRYNPTTGEIE